MATYEEQLFWREQLPSFYRKANAPATTKRLQAISYNDYAPIPLTSSPPSSLLTLPVELLYKIFAFARHDLCGGRESADIELVNSKYPTKLVQICRYWRVLALRDSSLWATIVVMDSTPGALQRVRLWLLRTGTTCPLSLQLGACLKPKDMEDIMKLLLIHLHRWRKVYFEFTPDSINALQLLAQLPQGLAPHLKSICMESSQPDLLAEAVHQAWASLSSAGSLQMAAIRNQYIPPVPWHQLTCLSVRSIGAQTILDILSHCQCLEYLDISYPFRNGLPRCSSPLVLPSLRSLELYTEMNATSFLDCLTTPALVNLSISQSELTGFKPCPASLHDFLIRSRCSLQSFELTDYELSEEEFVQCIQSPMLSTVTSVVLNGRLSDVMIEALTIGKPESSIDSSPLFPKIYQLKISTFKASKDGLVEGMLLSRLQTGRLKQVDLTVTGNHIPGDFVSYMKERFHAELTIYGDW